MRIFSNLPVVQPQMAPLPVNCADPAGVNLFQNSADQFESVSSVRGIRGDEGSAELWLLFGAATGVALAAETVLHLLPALHHRPAKRSGKVAHTYPLDERMSRSSKYPHTLGFLLNDTTGQIPVPLTFLYNDGVAFGEGAQSIVKVMEGGHMAVSIARENPAKASFEIYQTGKTWMVKRVGHSKGVYVNGKPLRRTPLVLMAGDEISIGLPKAKSTSFTFRPYKAGDPRMASEARYPAAFRLFTDPKLAHGFFYKEDNPVEMLCALFDPADIRGMTRHDPVSVEGYDEAVRELHNAAQTEILAGRVSERAKMLLHYSGLVLGDIEPVTAPDVIASEVARVLPKAELDELMGDIIGGWPVDDVAHIEKGDPSFIRTASQMFFKNRHTTAMLYRFGVGGDARAFSERKKEWGILLPPGNRDMDFHIGEWLFAGHILIRDADRFNNGSLGRFYFAVKPEFAARFWDKMKSMLDQAKTDNKKHIQAKISTRRDRFEAGDNTVIYFHYSDEEYFYNAAVRLVLENPDWFHEDRRPAFSAQVLYDTVGGNIIPVKGLAFAQDPPGNQSANERIAKALSMALKNERFRRIMGKTTTEEERMSLIMMALKYYHVDPEYPALSVEAGDCLAGRDIFPFILAHTEPSFIKVEPI